MPENAPAHTPRPWEWHDARTMRHLVAPNSERRALGVSMPLPTNKAYWCITAEDAANARLLAAAPDLLAALQQMLRCFDPYDPTDEQAAACDAAKAVIARVMGK